MGSSGAFLYGPYFFQGNPDGACYRVIVRKTADDLASENLLCLAWFQQDGATPHSFTESVELVRTLFGTKIVGRRLEGNWRQICPHWTFFFRGT